ncbi:MAG TPA: hypothetical protein VKB86_14505 [Pyrinomonadaceae bacterium]|nr:hypothetical protein [Pyrinomonadaceae bacterium]
MLKKLGAIAVAITAILTLVFLVFPWLKPESPPKDYGAEIKVVSVEPGVSFDQELSQLDVSRLGGSGKYKEKYGQSTGVVVRFECTIKGQKDAKYPLQWTVFDATTKTRVEEADLHSQLGWPTSAITQKGTQAQSAGDVWIPYPKRAGTFFVKLELIDPDSRQPLAYADSMAFNVP